MSICKQSSIKNDILLLKCIYLCKIDAFFIILFGFNKFKQYLCSRVFENEHNNIVRGKEITN